MSLVTQTEEGMSVALRWTRDLFGIEPRSFEAAFLTRLKLEFPDVTRAACQELFAQRDLIVAQTELQFAGQSGRVKWSHAMQKLDALLEYGVKGFRMTAMSATLKESLLQSGALLLKAGFIGTPE